MPIKNITVVTSLPVAPAPPKPTKWKGNRRAIGEDFFETPQHATEPIRPYIPAGVKTIWEPTYGKGAIGKLLEAWGYKVIKTDLYPKTEDTVGADFLTCAVPECDMLIFNPPFSLKTEFLKRACEIGKPFIFICPITIMETQTRFDLFKEHELSVLNLPNRVNYVGKAAAKGKNKVCFHSIWIVGFTEHKNKIMYAE
jgi:hypothetical protein